jgi:hypothetical protein
VTYLPTRSRRKSVKTDTILCLLSGVLVGALCALAMPAELVGPTADGIGLPSAAVAYADTCYTSPGATNSGTTGHGYNPGTSGTQGVQANISFNTSHLGVNDICGGEVAYWIGYVGPSSGGTYCGGGTGFVQDGWVAYENSQQAVYQFFSYYQDGTGNPGCGPTPMYQGAISSGHTYKVLQLAYPYYGGCYGAGSSQLQFWEDSTLMRTACVYWTSGQSIEEETERYGIQTHIGAIGYWWTEYCQNPNLSGCTPNIYIPMPAGSGYTDPDGYSYIDYLGSPNFNTCDSRDFTYSTC